MFGLFKKMKVPPRHRSAAYMNLAFDILPTAVDVTPNAWDTPPAPLLHLTDELPFTHLTTAGVHNDADQTYIEIDLGREYEVYEINVTNLGADTGFNQAVAAVADVDIHLMTGITGEDVTSGDVRDTQVLAHDGVWYDSTLEYVGCGIPVRYVWIEFTPDGANDVSVDLNEIKVFGC